MPPKKQPAADLNAQFLRKQRSAIDAIAADNLALKQRLVLENRAAGAATSSTAAALIVELRGQADAYSLKIAEEQRHRDELKHRMGALRERTVQQRQLMGGVGASVEQELQARRRVALLEDRLQQAATRASEAAARTAALRARVDSLRRDRMAFGELKAKQERTLRRAQRSMVDLLGSVAESLDARHKAILLQAQVRARAEHESATCETEWQRLTQAIEADRRMREQRRAQEQQRRAAELAALVSDARNAQQAHHAAPPAASVEGAQPTVPAAAKVDPVERTRRVQAAIQQVLAATGMRSIEELVDAVLASEEGAGRLFSYASALSVEADSLEQRARQEGAALEAQRVQHAAAQHDHRTKALQELDESLAEADRSAEAAEAREHRAAQAVAGLLAAVGDMVGTTNGSVDRLGAEADVVEGEGKLTERNLMRHLGSVEVYATGLLQKYCTLLMDDKDAAAEQAIVILGGSAQHGPGLGPIRYAIDPPSATATAASNDHGSAWKIAAARGGAGKHGG